MFRIFINAFLIAGLVYFGAILFFSVINLYTKWFGKKRYLERHFSQSVEDSKSRGVFVRELKYQVEGYDSSLNSLTYFLETAYRTGKRNEVETIPFTSTSYPYEIGGNFPYRDTLNLHLSERSDQVVDSNSGSRVFLKNDGKIDTVYYDIRIKGVDAGTVKVWD